MQLIRVVLSAFSRLITQGTGQWPFKRAHNKVRELRNMGLTPKPYQLLFFVLLFTDLYSLGTAQPLPKDTARLRTDQTERYNSFYDTLRSRAGQKKFTRLLHNMVFDDPEPARHPSDSLRNLTVYEGKTIGKIQIVRLDVFGPSLRDTTRKAKLWYEKAGNFIHTRSDLHNIRKNLLFKKGEELQTGEIYENERLLRALPYIRDARFYLEPDTLDPGLVNVILLIQDRFSIGLTGDVTGSRSATLEVYNRNIFGVGHEIAVRFVGHLTREPFMGIETLYKVSNIGGRFISFNAGYMNTYLNEGVMAVLDNGFLRTSDDWGYGIAGYLYKRTLHFPGEQIQKNYSTLGYNQFSGWGGHNFQLGSEEPGSQLTLSGQYIYRQFTDRPPPLQNGEQFFHHSRMVLTGLTWSKREFVPDELIFGYGITEDIPKGFKNELVVGYDNAESGNRIYSHLYLSNGNILGKKKGYMYLSAGIGGYLDSGAVKQGLIEFSSRYISRLITRGNARFRQFFNIEYKSGINRYEIEELRFAKNDLIRGFESREVTGKQRLSLNMETVYFQKRDFYRFNLAFFTFGDLGIIGSDRRTIFRGHYYSGLGAGLRLHNESLVFKTLQIRLSFYPNHPKDVGFFGFLLNEHTRQTFYSFQPEPPAPRRFE
ncbi:MAG: hypothetical protein QM301_05045 [Bacteroidota bacterium]|jgi:hypothetical protein|nr:hypothetical protein [Prolixibacteraceae bacterium]MDI9563545.1 hypothetical protein [Bacteroidota bacterium]NLS99037.1 hypothetical protein [Bacteroidales bacterium]HNZ68185.1 hypothetical protein [Prolixibacteraceae bacterium]HOG95431.1 hypothetical protein [Prolixibacteraceae bacterium]